MALIQQEFQHDEWKMLVGCIMLNQTSNKNVRQVIYTFFDRWSNPQSVIDAPIEDLIEHIRPLGFYNVRAKRLKRFSYEYITKSFKDASELYGIGKYANDSYEIFIRRNLNVNPTDKILRKYLNGEYIGQ